MTDLSLIPQNRVENLSTQLGATVNTSGNQTISGEKTFTSTTRLTAATPQITYKSTNMDITQSGWTPGRNTIAWCQDKNGNESGGVYNRIETNGTSVMTSMYAMSRKTGSQTNGHITIGVDESGNAFSYAPAPTASNSTSSINIATVGWVNNSATSTNVVHRSGNETIEGSKVLLNNLHIKNSNIEQLTVPDSYSERCLFAYDKNNVRIGSIGFAMTSDGASRTYIESSKVINGTANYGLIESYTDLNGNHSYYIGGNLVKGFVKSTYQSGTNWYRIWSDGWIEQGGQFAGSTTINASTTTVTFIKPFTSYVAIAGGFTKTSNSATYGQNIWQNGNTTLTTMICSLPAYSSNGNVSHASSAGTGYWYACGY